MRFLIDNAILPVVSRMLKDEGNDAVHVRDLKGRGAMDESIFEYAFIQNRVIVSSDTDFTFLLAN